MWKIIGHDLIGLFQTYRDSEIEKYDNTPDSFKGSRNAERMLKNAEMYQDAIDLLWDEKEDVPRPVDKEILCKVERIVDEILG